MIRWLNNVLRGRYRHWNDANNRQFTLIWQRSEQLAQRQGSIFREFLISSLSLVDLLLGPDKGKDRLLARDSLSISAAQFEQLHYIHVAGLAGMFAAIDPSLKGSLHASVKVLVRDDQEAAALFEELAKGRPDLQVAGTKLWCRIVNAVGDNVGITPALESYRFTITFGAVAIDTFQSVRNKCLSNAATQ